MEKLTIRHQTNAEADAHEVALKGALDVFSYMELKDYLGKVQGESPRSIVLDLSQVDYVGSSGWSVLFVQATLLENGGRRMILAGMSERVAHALDMIMPKKRLLDVAKDVKEGYAMLKARPAAPVNGA